MPTVFPVPNRAIGTCKCLAQLPYREDTKSQPLKVHLQQNLLAIPELVCDVPPKRIKSFSLEGVLK